MRTISEISPEISTTPARQGMLVSLRERFVQRPDSEHQTALTHSVRTSDVGLDVHEECRNSALICH
jgi:hypothetical protein